MMNTILLAAAAPAFVLADAVQQPNILMVVVDDLGWGDAAWTGSDDSFAANTPNLMSLLSEEGVVLDKFYAAPECTPSRAQLMTGRYSSKIQMQDSVIHGTEPRGVPLEEVFLSEKMQTSGYSTFAVGKWHLGFYENSYTPLERGFDEFYGILTGGGSHYTHETTEEVIIRDRLLGSEDETVLSVSGKNLWENDAPLAVPASEDVHTTTLYSERALEYIEQSSASTKPFFMYLSYQAVHGPIQVDSSAIDGTTDNGCDATFDGDDEDIEYGLRGKVCGMMSMVDDGIGNLVSQLKSDGRWDNTVLLFFSDNGGVKLHGSSNSPLRGEKGEYFEGGVRTPAFVAGGYTAAALDASAGGTGADGHSVNTLAHISDIHATVLGLAGYEDPNDAEKSNVGDLDGLDLWSSWTLGEEHPREEVLLNVNSPSWGGGGALIYNQYKLLVENSVGDSIVYTAGRDYIQDAGHEVTSAELYAYLEERRQIIFSSGGDYYLFDLSTEGGADESENVFNNAEYTEVAAMLLARWDVHTSEMSSSNELWQDDGILAAPLYFGGSWGPWRDSAFEPFATFSLAASDVDDSTLEDHSSTTSLLASGGAVEAWVEGARGLAAMCFAFVVGGVVVRRYDGDRRQGTYATVP